MTFSPEQFAAMSKLYDDAIDTEVSTHAMDFMARAQLLMDIAGDDIEAAKGSIHTGAGREAAMREYDELSDDDRHELLEVVAQHSALNLNLAVRKLWHAANVLGFKPDTLDPMHVAMTAATYLSRSPRELLNEMAKPRHSTDP